MQLNELVEKITRLPEVKRQEVIDFVTFLEARYTKKNYANLLDVTNWSEADFNQMSLNQAMRGLEDEPNLYNEADLKERWS